MSTANLLRAYAKALDGTRTGFGVSDADVRFWPDGAPAHARGIYDAHLRRVNGEGSPSECDAALQRAIKEIGQ